MGNFSLLQTISIESIERILRIIAENQCAFHEMCPIAQEGFLMPLPILINKVRSSMFLDNYTSV